MTSFRPSPLLTPHVPDFLSPHRMVFPDFCDVIHIVMTLRTPFPFTGPPAWFWSQDDGVYDRFSLSLSVFVLISRFLQLRFLQSPSLPGVSVFWILCQPFLFSFAPNHHPFLPPVASKSCLGGGGGCVLVFFLGWVVLGGGGGVLGGCWEGLLGGGVGGLRVFFGGCVGWVFFGVGWGGGVGWGVGWVVGGVFLSTLFFPPPPLPHRLSLAGAIVWPLSPGCNSHNPPAFFSPK